MECDREFAMSSKYSSSRDEADRSKPIIGGRSSECVLGQLYLIQGPGWGLNAASTGLVCPHCQNGHGRGA